jgi:hypothetical protein
MRAFNLARTAALLGAFSVCTLAGSVASAGVDNDRPGSILIFPKVVSSATRDTTIRISNTGNLTNEIRCFYLNGETCGSIDFDLTLTKQQPTHWDVSSGRAVNLLDEFASSGAGLDPGSIPPSADFEGSLVCVEVVDDVPVAQNKLKGEAIIRDASGEASSYNATVLTSGSAAGNSDNRLVLDGNEYAQCATEHRIDFIPNTDPGLDPVLGPESSVVTNVTVLPCDLDFSRRRATDVVLNATLWNEFESQTSGPDTTFSCWTSFSIDPASLNPDPTTFATVEYSASSPVVMVVESFHTDEFGATGSAAGNVHNAGGEGSSTITLSATP